MWRKTRIPWHRKLKPGDPVAVFPMREPAHVVSVGPTAGYHGEQTRVYLTRDSDGSRISARITQVYRP
jgi:hypothetical protein